MLYQIHTYSNSTDTVDSVATWLGEIQICLSNNPNVQFRVCNTIDSQNTKQLENYFYYIHLNHSQLRHVHLLCSVIIIHGQKYCVYFNEHQNPQFCLILKIFIFVAEFSAHETQALRMVSAKMQNRCHRCHHRLPTRNQLHTSVLPAANVLGLGAEHAKSMQWCGDADQALELDLPLHPQAVFTVMRFDLPAEGQEMNLLDSLPA